MEEDFYLMWVELVKRVVVVLVGSGVSFSYSVLCDLLESYFSLNRTATSEISPVNLMFSCVFNIHTELTLDSNKPMIVFRDESIDRFKPAVNQLD